MVSVEQRARPISTGKSGEAKRQTDGEPYVSLANLDVAADVGEGWRGGAFNRVGRRIPATLTGLRCTRDWRESRCGPRCAGARSAAGRRLGRTRRIRPKRRRGQARRSRSRFRDWRPPARRLRDRAGKGGLGSRPADRRPTDHDHAEHSANCPRRPATNAGRSGSCAVRSHLHGRGRRRGRTCTRISWRPR